MAATINADNGVVSGSSGLKSTADTSGVLALQSNGSTGLTLNTDLSVTFAGAQTLSAGTANGVTYLNGSKVLTSGSALTFDGTNFGLGSSTINTYYDRTQQIYGTASSSLKLTNGTAGTANTDGFDVALNGTTALLYNRESGDMAFGVNNTEGMRLTSTGLGIGTNSPGSKLDVYGTVRTTLAADSSYYGVFTNSGGATQLDARGSGATLQLLTAGSTRFLVGPSGQLGIGGATYGTSGQVLTSGGSGAAPSWSTLATPTSGLTFIGSYNLAGSTYLYDLTTQFTSTYDDYVILFENVNWNSNGSILLLAYTAGVLRDTSIYWYINANNGPGTGINQAADWGTGYWPLTELGAAYRPAANTSYCSGIIRVYNASINSGRMQLQWQTIVTDTSNSSRNVLTTGGGMLNTGSNSLTGLQFTFQGSTATTGRIRVYGVQKS